LPFSLPGLILAVAPIGYAQQPTTATGTKAAPKNAAAPAAPSLAMPVQQRRFCEVYEQDIKRQNALEEQKAEATNPIGAAQLEHGKPDFERILRAQQFAVMGKGAFENWAGYAIPAVDGFRRAYLQVEFPCKWTAAVDNSEQGKNLYLTSKTSFAIDSPEAKELAKLKPRDKVFVSGSLFCGQVAAFVGSGGCEGDASRNAKQIVRADFATIRSEKSGVVARVGKDPEYKPEIDHFKDVDLLRRARITFYKTDTLEALQTKAIALVAQKANPDSIKLLDFLLSAPQCARCNDSLKPIHFTVVDGGGFSIYVEGDLPSLKGVVLPPGRGMYVPTKDGACTVVAPQDLQELRQNTQQLTEQLRPLGMQLVETNNPLPAVRPNPCDSLNAADTKRAEAQATTEKQRVEATKAVSVSVTADEFSVRLVEAVKDRASKLGADPSQYVASIKTVSDMVRLCSSMPAADFAVAFDQFGRSLLRQYKAGAYKDCAAKLYDAVPMNDAPGLLVSCDLRQHWDDLQKLWYAPKFHVDVSLKRIKSDTSPPADYPARYMALSADVTSSGPTAMPRYLCPGTQVVQVGGGKVTISTPVRITGLREIAGEPWVEGEGFGLQRIAAAQVKVSCAAANLR
jgi:hypothetical protein